jgi:uncharacterized protein YbcC (UPF0753/DUF2309 family)
VETRLLLERSPEAGATGADALHLGFSVPEMAAIVRNAVRTMGMHPRYSPIVMMIGHGSVSLNNPHRSAYDCGAAGGSQGGPNARAFAMMANHPEVRKVLAGQGIVIPGDCWFVGAFHNTADDSVTYFDVEAIPAPLRPSFEKAQEAMSKACELNAHERCRRFEAAPPDLHPSGALLHVQTRSGDLGEARPELGHATNAACIVGRREKTRGLFLDRRAFLVSYDPVPDSDGSILAGILKAVGPVGAGINLEYLFSTVDSPGYGCGTKLPHNVSGLIGVMDGHQSDLRTGLPWQMVEIHEPMRLLVVIEAEPERLLEICGKDPVLAQLVTKHWIQTIAWSPSTGKMQRFGRQGFEPYEPEGEQVPVVPNSVEHYRGRIGHLWPARLEKR